MDGIKIAIIGAGSSYTPEIVEGMVQESENLPIREIAMMDIDASRLEIMANFCRRFLDHLGHPVKITTTSERRRAIEAARFVVVQIRVGGNAQRILDEKIPLKYGVIGQETTGPGGMMKALRTIPAVLEIARDVEQASPEAWILNYTNPTGILAEAVTQATHARIAGLCSGGLFPKWVTSKALQVAGERVRYDYVGLNHLNFAYNITIDGRPLSEEEFDRVAEVATWGSVDPDLIKKLRLIPSPYLQYFYHASKKVEEARRKKLTRGEEVQEIERIVFQEYADESRFTKPEALSRRGGGGYSEVAIGVMKALVSNQEKVFVVNVPNRGAVSDLPEEAVVEIPCLVNAAGISGITMGPAPKAVWGLICAVKNYEQLTIEAALTGSRDTALLALLAHPLVGDYEIAGLMLDELLEANREFLPQFFSRETVVGTGLETR